MFQKQNDPGEDCYTRIGRSDLVFPAAGGGGGYPGGPPGPPAYPEGVPPAATYGLPARAPPLYSLEQEQMGGFSEASVRRGFIRKVYGILLCQLIITGALIAAFMFVVELKM